MEKDKKEEMEEVNLLDILFDEDNEEPITLYDENDKKVVFDQVAIIPLNEKVYAILKPIDKMEGVADDEAIVFLIDQKGEEVSLVVESNEEVAVKVFDEYYKLLEKENN